MRAGVEVFDWIYDILSEEDSKPRVPHDSVFRGVGWGSLHSDIENPESDFMVSFRSSP